MTQTTSISESLNLVSSSSPTLTPFVGPWDAVAMSGEKQGFAWDGDDDSVGGRDPRTGKTHTLRSQANIRCPQRFLNRTGASYLTGEALTGLSGGEATKSQRTDSTHHTRTRHNKTKRRRRIPLILPNNCTYTHQRTPQGVKSCIYDDQQHEALRRHIRTAQPTFVKPVICFEMSYFSRAYLHYLWNKLRHKFFNFETSEIDERARIACFVAADIRDAENRRAMWRRHMLRTGWTASVRGDPTRGGTSEEEQRVHNHLMHSLNGNPARGRGRRGSRKKNNNNNRRNRSRSQSRKREPSAKAVKKRESRKKKRDQLERQRAALITAQEKGLSAEEAKTLGAIIRGRGDYSIGQNLGGKVGSWIGGKLEGFVRKIFGSGDYDIQSSGSEGVAANSLVAESGVPAMHSDNSGASRFMFHEYLGNIQHTSAFNVTTFDIDVSNATTFPWISQIARCYQQWQLMGCVFFLRTLSSDTVTAPTQGMGSFFASVRYDVNSVPPTSKSQILNSLFSTSGKPSTNLAMAVECDRSQTNIPIMKVKTPNMQPVDLQLYMMGKLDVGTEGAVNDYPDAMELHVTYDIMFYKPQDPSGGGGPLTMFDLDGSDATRPLLPLADSIAVVQPRYNSLGVTISSDSKSIEFPLDLPAGSVYMVFLTNIGDGTSNIGWYSTFQGLGGMQAANAIADQDTNIVQMPSAASNSGCIGPIAVAFFSYDGTGTPSSPPRISINTNTSTLPTGGKGGCLMVLQVNPVVATGVTARQQSVYTRDQFFQFLCDVAAKRRTVNRPPDSSARLIDWVHHFSKATSWPISKGRLPRAPQVFDVSVSDAIASMARFGQGARARVTPEHKLEPYRCGDDELACHFNREGVCTECGLERMESDSEHDEEYKRPVVQTPATEVRDWIKDLVNEMKASREMVTRRHYEEFEGYARPASSSVVRDRQAVTATDVSVDVVNELRTSREALARQRYEELEGYARPASSSTARDQRTVNAANVVLHAAEHAAVAPPNSPESFVTINTPPPHLDLEEATDGKIEIGKIGAGARKGDHTMETKAASGGDQPRRPVVYNVNPAGLVVRGIDVQRAIAQRNEMGWQAAALAPICCTDQHGQQVWMHLGVSGSCSKRLARLVRERGGWTEECMLQAFHVAQRGTWADEFDDEQYSALGIVRQDRVEEDGKKVVGALGAGAHKGDHVKYEMCRVAERCTSTHHYHPRKSKNGAQRRIGKKLRDALEKLGGAKDTFRSCDLPVTECVYHHHRCDAAGKAVIPEDESGRWTSEAEETDEDSEVEVTAEDVERVYATQRARKAQHEEEKNARIAALMPCVEENLPRGGQQSVNQTLVPVASRGVVHLPSLAVHVPAVAVHVPAAQCALLPFDDEEKHNNERQSIVAIPAAAAAARALDDILDDSSDSDSSSDGDEGDGSEGDSDDGEAEPLDAVIGDENVNARVRFAGVADDAAGIPVVPIAPPLLPLPARPILMQPIVRRPGIFVRNNRVRPPLAPVGPPPMPMPIGTLQNAIVYYAAAARPGGLVYRLSNWLYRHTPFLHEGTYIAADTGTASAVTTRPARTPFYTFGCTRDDAIDGDVMALGHHSRGPAFESTRSFIPPEYEVCQVVVVFAELIAWLDDTTQERARDLAARRVVNGVDNGIFTLQTTLHQAVTSVVQSFKEAPRNHMFFKNYDSAIYENTILHFTQRLLLKSIRAQLAMPMSTRPPFEVRGLYQTPPIK